jgi:hypothetical protein
VAGREWKDWEVGGDQSSVKACSQPCGPQWSRSWPLVSWRWPASLQEFKEELPAWKHRWRYQEWRCLQSRGVLSLIPTDLPQPAKDWHRTNYALTLEINYRTRRGGTCLESHPWEAEAGGSWVWACPGLHSKTLSPKNQNKIKANCKRVIVESRSLYFWVSPSRSTLVFVLDYLLRNLLWKQPSPSKQGRLCLLPCTSWLTTPYKRLKFPQPRSFSCDSSPPAASCPQDTSLPGGLGAKASQQEDKATGSFVAEPGVSCLVSLLTCMLNKIRYSSQFLIITFLTNHVWIGI